MLRPSTQPAQLVCCETTSVNQRSLLPLWKHQRSCCFSGGQLRSTPIPSIHTDVLRCGFAGPTELRSHSRKQLSGYLSGGNVFFPLRTDDQVQRSFHLWMQTTQLCEKEETEDVLLCFAAPFRLSFVCWESGQELVH